MCQSVSNYKPPADANKRRLHIETYHSIGKELTLLIYKMALQW